MHGQPITKPRSSWKVFPNLIDYERARAEFSWAAVFIVLIIRTRGRFYRSRPGTLLLAVTFFVACTTFFLPYTPLGALFGFVPLPPEFVLLLLAITGAYLMASELVKGWFFRRFA